MRYVVIGAGAVGGTIGALLFEADREVVLVARGEHLAAIRERGLQFDEPGNSRTLQIPVVGTVAEAGWRPGTVALVCTKSQDSEAVLDELRAVAPDVPVVCVQNGVDNERLASSRFAEVLSICVMLPAEHLEPGRVVAYSGTMPGILDVGLYPRGVNVLAEQIAIDLNAAGFSSYADPAIMRLKYRKLLSNLGNAAVAACGPGDPDVRTLRQAAATEGARALTAAGIDFASTDEDKARRGKLVQQRPVVGQARGGGSTWQSLERGLGTVETQYLNGEIITLGQAHGVPTPINQLLHDTATSMARNKEKPGTRKAVELLAQAGGSTQTG